MKFVITDDQLKKLKLKLYQFKIKFLNSYVTSGTIRKFDSFIVIEDPSVDNDFEEPHMEYDSYDGRLFVNKEIRNSFIAMFNGDREETDNFIKHWFEDKFHVDVKFLA